MTRSEIEAEYKVENGVIRSPGKFEGEPVYAPHFYEALLNGESHDENEEGVATIGVLAEEIAEFPELAGVAVVSVREWDNGFVRVKTVEISRARVV